MSNNKAACIHIRPDAIRLVEGRVQNGIILVTHTASVEKAHRFFHGNQLVYMTDMVSAVVNAMNVNSFTAKEIYLAYDTPQISVDLDLEEGVPQRKQSRMKRKGRDKEKESNKIVHRKSWGHYISETDQGEMITVTSVEKDLVESLFTEFREFGYRVKSLEGVPTALFYLRKFVPSSYDAQNKLIIYADNQDEGVAYQITKDAPSGRKPLHFSDSMVERFADRVVNVIKEEISLLRWHNPHVMLVGDAFTGSEDYLEISRVLKELDLYNIDLYGTWRDRGAPINSVRVITQPGQDLALDGRYGIGICLLARKLEAKPENMVEGIRWGGLRKGQKKAIMGAAHFAAMLFLTYGVLNTAVSSYEMAVAQIEYNRASSASEDQVLIAETERDKAKAQLDSLHTIDNRYKDIFRFVYQQVNADLNIASVDTQDMIPTTMGAESVYDTPATAETPSNPSAAPEHVDGVEGTEAPPAPTAFSLANHKNQTIVIRGYARTTEGPIQLHNALIQVGLGEVKVVGVEQFTLPSGEPLFAFELTVGTNEGM